MKHVSELEQIVAFVVFLASFGPTVGIIKLLAISDFGLTADINARAGFPYAIWNAWFLTSLLGIIVLLTIWSASILIVSFIQDTVK